jgi:hypothetical protein
VINTGIACLNSAMESRNTAWELTWTNFSAVLAVRVMCAEALGLDVQ